MNINLTKEERSFMWALVPANRLNIMQNLIGLALKRGYDISNTNFRYLPAIGVIVIPKDEESKVKRVAQSGQSIDKV